MIVTASMILWTLVVTLLGVLALILRESTYWRLKGIPSADSFSTLDITLPVILRRKSFADVTLDCYNACPNAKYYGTMNFGMPVIVVKDPDILKDIAVKSFDNFPNHRTIVDEGFDPILARNLFSLKDDRWRKMRTTLSPTFTASKMKYLFELISKCSADFVQYFKEHPESTEDMDLKDVYTRYTNDVIATAAFGISVDSLREPNNHFYVNGKDVGNLESLGKMFKLIIATIFPRLMRLLGFSFLSSKSDKFFKSLIRDTLRSREEKGVVRPDMIHLLCRARDSENGIEMTTDDIIAQAFIFFFAGFDSSSRLMCFLSHVVSHHPEVQERLRKEVDTVFQGKEENITYDNLGRLKYMDMVISETLRLYPPTPFIDRLCAKTYVLPSATNDSKPFTVPPESVVWIPILGFHRDPNYFPDPDTFDPQRFSDENKPNIKSYTYMPFGFGPRKCIGERFALMETKLLMARLLQNFVLKASKKTTKVITFSKGASLMAPEKGFWMHLESRKTQKNILTNDRIKDSP